MRFVLGMIVGVLVTVWAAYLHDTAAMTAAPGAEARGVVNWEVVQNELHELGAKIGVHWSRPSGQVPEKS